MHLKRLELSGFKSFAEKTLFDFLPPADGRHSITGIVGPNGSGKSNVVDAIRWVMGEQRISQLRGKKSEDIIFAGADGKGKMGVASVSLILDNTDHRVDLPYDDVILTRRVYREGESEYCVNEHPVRLLDLQILLAKAQFAHGSYSIVGQGMIDEILLQTTEDRRAFFDEATGIKEFQIKRHQAALKLARTKENMAQAGALLNEVAPRLRSLSRQVKKLEQRQDVERALRELQESYYATLFTHRQSERDAWERKRNDAGNRVKAFDARMAILQEEAGALARDRSVRERFDVLQAALREETKHKSDAERDRMTLSAKLQLEYGKSGKQELGWVREKIDTLARERESAGTELTDAEERFARLSEKILERKEAAESAGISRTELRGSIASLERQLADRRHEDSFLEAHRLPAVAAILRERDRFGTVYGVPTQLAKAPERYHLALDIAAGQNLSSVVVADDRVGEACIAYLRGEKLGVATFLPMSGIKPRIVPHDIEKYLSLPGVHGLADRLVLYDQKFANIFSYIFGGTLIVDSLEVARRVGIGRIRMVTLEGDLLETSGAMKGGFRKKGGHPLSFSSRDSLSGVGESVSVQEEKLLSLRSDLVRAEQAYDDAMAHLREIETQAQVAAVASDVLGAKVHAIDSELSSLKQEVSLSSLDTGEYHRAMEEIRGQKDAVEERLASMESRIRHSEKEMSRLHEEEEKKNERMLVIQGEMQKIQESLHRALGEKNEADVSFAKWQTKLEDLEGEAFQELQESIGAVLHRAPPPLPVDRLETAMTDIQKLKYQLSLIGGIDEEVIAEYEETKTRHDSLSSQLTDLERAFADLETLIEELDETMKKKREKAFREIRKQFSKYFTILFEGGKADLVEVYGEDSAQDFSNQPSSRAQAEGTSDFSTDDENEKKPEVRKPKSILIGIDIEANPPGKKVKHLAALSGGERTMTALALVCAILHTNPAPFVVLDEVEAALDEANSIRFTNILRELATQSQFVVITHNRATMHAADALYGVTMGGRGVSEVVSVKMSAQGGSASGGETGN